MIFMTTTTDVRRGGAPARPVRPERLPLLGQMLDATRRGAVPVRRAFLQTTTAGADGTRKGPLAAFSRDIAALDAYLLIHAMASASDPYDTWFPASTWAQVAGLDTAAEQEAAKARWAKLVTKLERAQLVKRKRLGNKMNFVLLHESGDGSAYTRPTKDTDGYWFGLPHIYWTQEFDKQLTGPEKVMLLIALDQPDGFRMPTDRTPSWYGISESTAHRGFKGLERRGIIDVRTVTTMDAKSPTGWKEVLHYTTLGDWSIPARRKAMKARGVGKPARVAVSFDPAATDAPEAGVSS